MLKNYIIPILLLTQTCIMAQSADCCKSTYDNLNTLSLHQLSKEYLRLKKTEDKCCEKWESDLHKIMQELGKQLGETGTTVEAIKKHMGEPDTVDDMAGWVPLEDGQQSLIYTWRGWHDWLYFVVEDGKVVSSDWWFAYE